jgi:hypothetical protein
MATHRVYRSGPPWPAISSTIGCPARAAATAQGILATLQAYLDTGDLIFTPAQWEATPDDVRALRRAFRAWHTQYGTPLDGSWRGAARGRGAPLTRQALATPGPDLRLWTPLDPAPHEERVAEHLAGILFHAGVFEGTVLPLAIMILADLQRYRETGALPTWPPFKSTITWKAAQAELAADPARDQG